MSDSQSSVHKKRKIVHLHLIYSVLYNCIRPLLSFSYFQQLVMVSTIFVCSSTVEALVWHRSFISFFAFIKRLFPVLSISLKRRQVTILFIKIQIFDLAEPLRSNVVEIITTHTTGHRELGKRQPRYRTGEEHKH
jgi:hypothetical protein